MKLRRWLGVVAIGSALLTACGFNGGSGPTSSLSTEVLRIAIGSDPDTLDPMRQTTTAVENIVNMVVESLTTVDENGAVQPSLAQKWDEAPDGMSWTFTLRDAVKFTDGTPFDAAAVKANIDRVSDPTNTCPQCGPIPKALKSVDVIDPGHVKFTMNVPLAADVLLGLLSTPIYGIVSPNAIKKGTPNYARQEKPVGTGPYALKGRVAGDSVTLTRNDAYWGKHAIFKEQEFMVVPDAATREALVRSGQAQVIATPGPPISDLPSLRNDPTVKVLLAPGDRMVFFAIDTQDKQQPLLQNPQVRQALNMAINRDAIIKATLFGAADPATSVMSASVFGYCPQTAYKYDPDGARTLLQRANATGLTVSLIAPTGRYLQDYQAAQNVAADLRNVGVNVQGPRTMDWPTYVGTIDVPPARASVDLHFLGWAPSYLDASAAVLPLDASQIPPKGLATAYYDNSNVAALLTKAQTEPNRNARAQEYCDAQKQIWNDAPWIFLWVQKFPIVYSSQITGVGSIPNEQFTTVYARPASS